MRQSKASCRFDSDEIIRRFVARDKVVRRKSALKHVTARVGGEALVLKFRFATSFRAQPSSSPLETAHGKKGTTLIRTRTKQTT